MRSFRFFMSMLTIRYISFTTSHMIVQRPPVQVHDYSYAQDYTQQMFGSFASKTALFRGVRRSVFSGFFSVFMSPQLSVVRDGKFMSALLSVVREGKFTSPQLSVVRDGKFTCPPMKRPSLYHDYLLTSKFECSLHMATAAA